VLRGVEMAEIRCEECGRVYQSRSGLRRHVKAEHGTASPSTGLRAGLDRAAARPTEDERPETLAAAERSEAVRWNRLLRASARFKLPADVYGQDLVFCLPLFCVIRSQI
jgi:hypothetical protein